jgi:hypothetical protein
MDLLQIIQSVPDFDTQTPEQIAAYLGESITVSDPTPYTFARLGEALGQTASAVVADTMARVANGELALPSPFERMRGLVYGAFIAMSATAEGIALNTDDRQQLIALLGSLGEEKDRWPSQLTAAVAGLGRRQQPRFSTIGGTGDLPTLEAISAAVASILLERTKQALRIVRANAYNADIAAIDAWDGSGDPPVL